MSTDRLVAMAALVVACAAPPAPRSPTPKDVGPALPAGFKLEVVVPWQAELVVARLRLDDQGRPFLVTQDTIVPLKQLPNGNAARPFRIAGVDAITDLTWS